MVLPRCPLLFITMRKKITYKEAGVDVEAGDRFVDLIRPLAASTYDDNVVGGVGGFSGFYSLPLGGYRDPVLVSATDGVGTKLKIAFLAGVFDTIGIDLVAMCVNDVVTSGARPLFFLDYIATSKLSLEVGVDVVSGIAEGCRQAGCALLGGETAEMPGFYREGEFDIAGFAVGIVDREKMIRPSKVKPGDKVVGLASSGLHSNGYSLVRKVLIDEMKMGLKEIPSLFDRTLGEILLTPTRIYAKTILALVSSFDIHGIAHITGGGLTGNIPRVIPPDCSVVLDSSSWHVPEVFRFIQEASGIGWEEMQSVFNCGIGMALIVRGDEVRDVMEKALSLGDRAFLIGEVGKRSKGVPPIVIE